MTHCKVIAIEDFYEKLTKICEKTQEKLDNDLEQNIIDNNGHIELFKEMDQKKGGSKFCKGMSKESIRRGLYIFSGAILLTGSIYCYNNFAKSYLEENGEPIRCEGTYLFGQNNHKRTSHFTRRRPTDNNHLNKCLAIQEGKFFFDSWYKTSIDKITKLIFEGNLMNEFESLKEDYRLYLLGFGGMVFYKALDKLVENIYKFCNDNEMSITNNSPTGRLLSNEPFNTNLNEKLITNSSPTGRSLSNEPFNTNLNKKLNSRKRKRKSPRKFVSKEHKKKIKKIIKNRNTTIKGKNNLQISKKTKKKLQ
jgi:hypothetical protein